MITALVLAAGSSRRLGEPKQLLTDQSGTPLVGRAVREARAAGCERVVVVTGAHAAEVSAALDGLLVEFVFNNRYADGMGSSIACGVRHVQSTMLTDVLSENESGENSSDAVSSAVSATNTANEGHSADALLILACDMPSVSDKHLRALIEASAGGQTRVASTYGDDSVVGIPALFPHADWGWLAKLTGDRGAKPLLCQNGTLSIHLVRGMFDLDTPADVAAWRAAATSASSPTFIPGAAMPSLAQAALADMEHEMAHTRVMLERVPEAHLDFTPHAKSWPLKRLANHITDFPMWGTMTIHTDRLNFGEPQPPAPPIPTTAAGFVAQFDERMASFRAAMANVSDSTLMEMWTMRNGEQVLMTMPKVAVLRGMVMSHMIHHRAQLTMYYRMLDVSVPGLYGPSADEAWLS